MPDRRVPRPRPQPFRFTAIGPLRHRQPEKVVALSELVAEAATWFFEDPQLQGGRTTRPELTNPNSNELNDAVGVATELLEGGDARAVPGAQGTAAVNIFCQRFIDKEPKYTQELRGGRTIGQRHLLCALTLRQLELTARAIDAGDAVRAAAYMADVVDLTCEVRRALDREAGSDVASRGARKRHERTYQIRRLAEQLYDNAPGRSIAAKATSIYPEVESTAKQLGAPLTPTRGPKTVYDWLRAYQRAKNATLGD